MAVNFYKFAAAMMELLEPHNYNFSSRFRQSMQTDVLDRAAEAFQLDGDSPEAAVEFDDAPANHVLIGEQHSQTVEIMAARLTETIAGAAPQETSQSTRIVENAFAEIAAAEPAGAFVEIFEFAQTVYETKRNAETNISDETADAPATLLAKDEQAAPIEIAERTLPNKIIENTGELNQISAVAAQPHATETEPNIAIELPKTVDETIEQNKTIEPTKSFVQSDSAAQFQSIAENKQTTFAEPTAESSTDMLENSIEAVRDASFWDLFPEIDPLEIKYIGVMSYLYDYMSDRDLLDFFNPEIEFTDRQQLVMEASVGARNQNDFEANLDFKNQQTASDDQDRARDAEREDAVFRARLQNELQQRQRLDRQRFEERLYAERKKDEM